MTNQRFDTKKFLDTWKQQKRDREKEEWLFAAGIVTVGLEQEGNLDETAQREIKEALQEFEISPEELTEYLKKNRLQLLEFLNSYGT